MTPSVSILQISDLHRERRSPIRNEVLLNSLENDRTRYTTACDGPAIRQPDIVVVSGDVIYGVAPGTADHEARLAEQYQEALCFLGALTDRLFASDRERLVLVPGNHDVSACHFMQSLERVELAADSKKELVSELFHPGSTLRWSWREFGLYKVSDPDRYAQRLAPFATFYREFYRGARNFDLDPAKQFDIFDYPDSNLTIVSFSSCPPCIHFHAGNRGAARALYQGRLRA